jgi:hypothetical protein
MKLTVARVKEIIKEEYQKVREHEELDVMVKGYGNLGSDPMVAIKSAKGNLDIFRRPFDFIDEVLASNKTPSVEDLQSIIESLIPLKEHNQIELAIAKLSGVLEHLMKLNEVKDEEK